MKRFMSSLIVLSTAVLVVGSVQAADFPSKEIRVIVPWNPGGSTDIMARTIQPIAEKQGYRLVIENMPGGGSAIGIGQVVTSRPDGYTVGLASSSLLSLIAQKQVPYDTRSFTSIVRFSEDPLVLVVPNSSKFTDIESFMKFLADNSGKTTIATPGSKNVNHAMAVTMAMAVGAEFRHVPYPGGGRIIAELIGGHIDAAILKPSETIQQIKGGGLRALAVYRDKRLDILPDVPTFTEKGFNVFPFGKVTQTTFLVAPAGIQPDVRDKLAAIFKGLTTSPEFQAFADQNGFLSDGLSGDEFNTYVTELSAALDKVAEKAFNK